MDYDPDMVRRLLKKKGGSLRGRVPEKPVYRIDPPRAIRLELQDDINQLIKKGYTDDELLDLGWSSEDISRARYPNALRRAVGVYKKSTREQRARNAKERERRKNMPIVKHPMAPTPKIPTERPIIGGPAIPDAENERMRLLREQVGEAFAGPRYTAVNRAEELSMLMNGGFTDEAIKQKGFNEMEINAARERYNKANSEMQKSAAETVNSGIFGIHGLALYNRAPKPIDAVDVPLDPIDYRNAISRIPRNPPKKEPIRGVPGIPRNPRNPGIIPSLAPFASKMAQFAQPVEQTSGGYRQIQRAPQGKRTKFRFDTRGGAGLGALGAIGRSLGSLVGLAGRAGTAASGAAAAARTTSAAATATRAATAARAANAASAASRAAPVTSTAIIPWVSPAAQRAALVGKAAAASGRTGSSASGAARASSSAAAASRASAAAAAPAATLGSRATMAGQALSLGLGIGFPIYSVVTGEIAAKRDAALIAAQQAQERADRADAAARQIIADELQAKLNKDYEDDRKKAEKLEADAKLLAAQQEAEYKEAQRLAKIAEEKAIAEYLEQQALIEEQRIAAEERQLAAIEAAIQSAISRGSNPYGNQLPPPNTVTPTNPRQEPVYHYDPYVPPVQAPPPRNQFVPYVPPVEQAPPPRKGRKGGAKAPSIKSLKADLARLGYRL